MAPDTLEEELLDMPDAAKSRSHRVSHSTFCGAVILVLMACLAAAAPHLAGPNHMLTATDVQLTAANLPPGSPAHLLGTDSLGRDILLESMWGARASLAVGILAASIAVLIGAVWGAFSAFAGGLIDTVMMRIVDGLLAIPGLILALALQAVITSPQPSLHLPEWLSSLLRVTSYSQGLLPLVTVVAVISATTWLEAARVAHAQILTVKSRDYVEAARALGVSTARMLYRHLLPNIAVPLVVEATLLVSDAVLMEAGLSYLGVGLGPAIPSWGGMVATAQTSLLAGNWWAATVPGLCIASLVLAVNLVGEGLIKTHRRALT